MKYILIIALTVMVYSASGFTAHYRHIAPDSIPADSCSNEGYTNCETCVGPMGNGVPWGPIQMISYPMANIPNDLIACGPQPGCVLEIYFRKRMCGDTVQMKVSGFKYVGCTANNCYCKEFISRNAHGTFVHAAAAGAFIENSFNLFNVTPFSWTNVKILSYTCYGIYTDINGCSPIYVIPCKEYACCEYSLRVTSDAECGTLGFIANWLDVSGVKGSHTNPFCEVCQRYSNHKPSKPYPDSSIYQEYEDIIAAMSLPSQNEYLFGNNSSSQNACVYSCFSGGGLWSDKMYYMKNGKIFPVNLGRKQKRRK